MADAESGPDDERQSDALSVAAVRSGALHAFEAIMRRHNRRLYRLARSIVKNAAEAEDIVQETYIRAFNHLDQYGGQAPFSAWLARIARNQALACLRRRGAVSRSCSIDKSAAAEQFAEPEYAVDTPEDAMRREQLARVLEAAIDRLPLMFRSVFVMRAVEQLSVEETAAYLEIRPATVKTRFFRARALLRDHLCSAFDANSSDVFDFGGSDCDRIVTRVLKRLAAAAAADRHKIEAPGDGGLDDRMP